MPDHDKLKSAEFYLAHMSASVANEEAFRMHFSAFLSQARSVVQHTIEEVDPRVPPKKERKGGRGRAWFEKAQRKTKLVKFFGEVRDEDIHYKSVTPNKDTTLPVTGFEMQALLGNQRPSSPRQPWMEGWVSEPVHRYWVDQYPDDDLLDLCRRYLDELRAIVEDGQKKGWLRAK